MNIVQRTLVVIISVCLSNTAVGQTTVSIGDLNVAFPHEPEKTEDDDGTQYQLHDRSMGYLMKVTMTYSNAPAENILQNEIDQKRTDGADKKIDKTIDIKLGDHEGREVQFSADLGGHKVPITCRVYAIGNTVYWFELIDIYNAGLYETIGKDFFESITLR